MAIRLIEGLSDTQRTFVLRRRSHILRARLFSQPRSHEAKNALVAETKAHYKVQVQDADFFVDAP
jgi:hypothetical protein